MCMDGLFYTHLGFLLISGEKEILLARVAVERRQQVCRFSSFCPEKSVNTGVSMSKIADVILWATKPRRAALS
jgi:hypothetical protein